VSSAESAPTAVSTFGSLRSLRAVNEVELRRDTVRERQRGTFLR
jgi:hypothetical protein